MKNIFILFICVFYWGCASQPKEIDMILYYNRSLENFLDLSSEELKIIDGAQEIDIESFTKMMDESTKEGFLLVKGGWRSLVIFYNDGNIRKLSMSMAYGIYRDVDSGKYYQIASDASLGNGNWDRFLKK